MNDKRFVDAALKLDPSTMLKLATRDQCACSAGAAAAAVAVAKKLGANKAHLVDYYTSYDIIPRDSFVGYMGAVLEGRDLEVKFERRKALGHKDSVFRLAPFRVLTVFPHPLGLP